MGYRGQATGQLYTHDWYYDDSAMLTLTRSKQLTIVLSRAAVVDLNLLTSTYWPQPTDIILWQASTGSYAWYVISCPELKISVIYIKNFAENTANPFYRVHRVRNNVHRISIVSLFSVSNPSLPVKKCVTNLQLWERSHPWTSCWLHLAVYL